MQFRSRVEAYTYAIHILRQLPRATAVSQCIENIKIAYENHIQDTEVVVDALFNLQRQMSDRKTRNAVLNVIDAVQSSPYESQNVEDRFANPLGRRWESEFAVLLLKQPSKATMRAVEKVSQAIIETMDFSIKYGTRMQRLVLDNFRCHLIETDQSVCLGAFDHVPSFEEIREVLRQNSPQQLARIMQIQYRFARYVYRDLPALPPARQPCGAYADLVQARYGSFAAYLQAIRSANASADMKHHKEAAAYIDRAFISDEIFYASPLYRAEPSRGRRYRENKVYTAQLGLMLLDQQEDALGLPGEPTCWEADCIAGNADFSSRLVRDALENDTLYVTGPSGMTSLFLGQMEVLANLESVELKQHYLSAVLAYIAASGFHNIHEVVGPAQYALKLVPGYEIHVPDVDGNTRAPPPNYHKYFEVMSAIDPEFAALREKAWERYLEYFEKIYLLKIDVRDRLVLRDRDKEKVEDAAISRRVII